MDIKYEYSIDKKNAQYAGIAAALLILFFAGISGLAFFTIHKINQ
jgi:hypothetical protein